MTPWLKLAVWLAVVALPGGMLLLPVVIADLAGRRRAVRRSV